MWASGPALAGTAAGCACCSVWLPIAVQGCRVFAPLINVANNSMAIIFVAQAGAALSPGPPNSLWCRLAPSPLPPTISRIVRIVEFLKVSSAGLAPHHDDVEIFVVQTEGSKRWSIYRPEAGPHGSCRLANHCSGDLEEGGLGQPLMEFILEVGGTDIKL